MFRTYFGYCDIIIQIHVYEKMLLISTCGNTNTVSSFGFILFLHSLEKSLAFVLQDFTSLYKSNLAVELYDLTKSSNDNFPSRSLSELSIISSI